MLEHVTGEIPISVATSNALTSLFDKQKNAYRNYDLLTVNMLTVARNMLGSVKSPRIVKRELFELYDSELLIIRNVVNDLSNKKLKLLFYAGFYDKPHSCFPLMSRVKQLTVKQRELRELEIACVSYITANYKSNLHGTKLQVDTNAPSPVSNNPFAKVLVLTHLPTDLLFLGNASLTILESHTGAIKSQSQLNTKLKGKPENIPFNKITVQIMGDSGNVVFPAHIKDRKELIALANECNWNSATVYNTVHRDISKSNYPQLKKFLVKNS